MINAIKKLLPRHEIIDIPIVVIPGIFITESADSSFAIFLDEKKLFDCYIYKIVSDGTKKLFLFMIPAVDWSKTGSVPNNIMDVIKRIDEAQVHCWVYTRNNYFLFVDDWANIESLEMKVV